jgi:valyl-tRNA synthetase
MHSLVVADVNTIRHEPFVGCGAVKEAERLHICCRLPRCTGLFDAAKETDRLRKQEAKVQKALAGLQGRLANRSFLDNAAPAVVEEVRQQQVDGLKC